MSSILYWITYHVSDAYRSSWEWLAHLDRQQWLILLVVTTAAGFLCMRGFGSRDKY